jgi:ribose transport system ATP-binding protein
MRGIRKAFPGVLALDGVDFDLRRGEVHVLLGENGAGKSTLMKVLSGAHGKDAGEIALDGRVVEIDGPRRSRDLGISTIYQELNLIPHLSVGENIVLGSEPGRLGWIDRRRLHLESERLLAELKLDLDPRAPVRALGIAQQQMVEVAKALSSRASILIMDEPTSALTDSEIEQLFETITRLTAGGAGVIYISHRLEEVSRIGHRVTVLRDGRNVDTRRVGDVTLGELVRLMADREVTDHYPKRRVAPGRERLRVEGLRRGNVLREISFSVNAGEVVAIAGLLGAGRTELARAIVGADPIDGGRVLVGGREVRIRTPADAIRLGIGYLPEDRKTQGLILDLSLRANISLPSARRLSRWGLVRGRAEAALAQRLVDELRIKTTGLGQKALLLSGGNQQKVVLAKWLGAGTDTLILDEPTRGIDVAAKVEIYHLMNRLAGAGAAVLMISSELPEVLGMSDRILVMHEGRLQAEFAMPGATQAQVLGAALGRAS